MGDEDQSFEEGLAEEVGEEPESSGGPKIGFLSAGILKILKFVAIAIAALIVMVIVSVMVVRYMGQGTQAPAAPPASEQMEVKEKTYAYVEEAFQNIRTRTADTPPKSIMVNIALAIEEGDQATQTEINNKAPIIKDFLRSYFSNKTSAELGSEHEDAIKLEIRKIINDRFLESEGVKRVLFTELSIFEF
ncbi:MAG: flagellar basal body-associated FliL family protein [Spirochaetales bacterium]|nr:flagellar basal body-associated FliL family protein [Spirochaetales bacterium]MCF7937605.1 flagellar basal body-associated FliL family protein [Spirochaetales bacterium]